MSTPSHTAALVAGSVAVGAAATYALLRNRTSSATAVAAVAAAAAAAAPPASKCPRGGKVTPEFFEYSVIYTDRAVNLMAPSFQAAMRAISSSLKNTYSAAATVIIPGSGTYGMEAVAACFGTQKKCLVVRNGYFSYRWSDIMNVGKIPLGRETVMQARPAAGQASEKWPLLEPCPVDEIVARIQAERPAAVFAPHVETSTGIIVSDEYVRAVADAVHGVGGVLVLDCVASGTVWIDMEKTGVDVLITAPQKGWTGPACCGIVMMSARAVAQMKSNEAHLAAQPVSFCCNLLPWYTVMQQYENADGKGPGFKYYTTLPTDALLVFAKVIEDAKAFGLDKAKQKIWALGNRVRSELAKRGFQSVAAKHCAAPGVVVVYSPFGGMVGKFKQFGIQVAGGVPWKLGEETWAGRPTPKQTCFRIGLFGLDKVMNVDHTVDVLMERLDRLIASETGKSSM